MILTDLRTDPPTEASELTVEIGQPFRFRGEGFPPDEDVTVELAYGDEVRFSFGVEQDPRLHSDETGAFDGGEVTPEAGDALAGGATTPRAPIALLLAVAASLATASWLLAARRRRES